MHPIQQLRTERLKLTQKQFAAELQLTQSSVSQYERGDCSPSVAVLRRMVALARANQVEVSMDDLIGEPMPVISAPAVCAVEPITTGAGDESAPREERAAA
jgi:transcriptional regulator with XRE-family HTH domain